MSLTTSEAPASAMSKPAIPKIVSYLQNYMNARIIGQETFVDRLLLALFANGHILLEGAPGLAKTKAVNTLAETIEADARRIQFTPDLLPSDLTGTEIYRPENGTFKFQAGPLFHNLVLADEINRAPAKVQSALLEAMAERQVTVNGTTYPLPALFMVLATQNPIEQEGTYPLPEAQLDRFLLQVNIGYPSAEAEREILRLVNAEQLDQAEVSLDKTPLDEKAIDITPSQNGLAQDRQMVTIEAIFTARKLALQTHVADTLTNYIIQLIQATRYPEKYCDALAGSIEFGASPRATIALERCARVYAWMRGASFATPQDVQAVAHDVLRHRILLSFEAEADGISTDDVIDEILAKVPVV